MSLLMTSVFTIFVHEGTAKLPLIENILGSGCETIPLRGHIHGGAVATSHISNIDEKIIERKQIKTYQFR